MWELLVLFLQLSYKLKLGKNMFHQKNDGWGAMGVDEFSEIVYNERSRVLGPKSWGHVWLDP